MISRVEHFVYWSVTWNITALVMFVRGLMNPDASAADYQVILVMLAISAVVSAARWALRCGCCGLHLASSPSWLPWTLSPGFIVFTLWLMGIASSNLAIVFLWLLLAACEALWTAIVLKDRREPLATSKSFVSQDALRSDNDANETAFGLEDGVDQQITRRVDSEGETVSGLLRVRYESDQRVASAFAGFVPPLLPTQACEAEVVAGCEADVKIVDIHAQGVEFEVRRAAVDDLETFTVIEFYATANS